MPRRSDLRISKRTVDALSVEGKDSVFWDRDLAGFGVRIYTTGRKVYVMQSRGPRGLKRVTIGRHGEISAEQARKDAAVIIDRIKRGEDPVPAPPEPELTVAGLVERYVRAHVAVNCKANSARTYRGLLDKHILPELGDLPVSAVERGYVASLHYGFATRLARPTRWSRFCRRCSPRPRHGDWRPPEQTRADRCASTGSVNMSAS